jgi:hypothetical protein
LVCVLSAICLGLSCDVRSVVVFSYAPEVNV